MNTVAIVGRPNVGKSTLYNRFLQERRAIVHESEGVTRDRTYAEVEWSGRYFNIIDTGGITIDPRDTIEAAMREQALIAAEEADLLLLVVDVTAGVTQIDDYIARLLHRSGKPVIVVVNKVDDERSEPEVHVFNSLGFGPPAEVSAMTGRSSGDLLDTIIAKLPPDSGRKGKEFDIRIAILGMPNAGKSTIANTFLGKNRHIVTEIPGTTRDSIHSEMKYRGRSVQLVDTAGLRKKKRIHDDIEFYSWVRTRNAIRNSDVCILVADTEKGFGNQDGRIVQEIYEQRKGLVLAMNKWDLMEKETNTARDHTRELIYAFPVLANTPVIYVSALKKQRLLRLLDEAIAVNERMQQRIPTSELNHFFLDIIRHNPPPAVKGKYIRIKYVTQILENPPLIGFFCNEPKLVMDNYRKFLEAAFRKHYDFRGVPLHFVFKAK